MVTRYSIHTPPYGKGRAEPDENGEFVKYNDVKKYLWLEGMEEDKETFIIKDSIGVEHKITVFR